MKKLKFFTDFVEAWKFAHEKNNNGSKLRFLAVIAKYVVILPVLLWLVLSLSSCSACYNAVTVQGFTDEGASARHDINSAVKLRRKVVIFEGRRFELLDFDGDQLTAQDDRIIFKFTLKK